MEGNDQQAKATPNLAVGALFVGLISFVLWLLRLRPRPNREQPPQQMTGPRPHPYPAPGGMAPAGRVSGRPEALAPVRAPRAAKPEGPLPGETAAELAPPGSPMPGASTSWTTPSRYIAGVGLILAFLGLLYYSRQTLTLLIFAALIAILARPAMAFLQKRLHFPSGLAVITIYLAIAVLLFALPLLIVPNLVQAANSLLNIDWQGIIQRLAEGLEQAAAQVSATRLVGGLLSSPIQSLADFLQNLLAGVPETAVADVTMETMLSSLGHAVGLLANVVGPLVSGILSFVFLLLISLQMSLAGDQVRGWVMKLVPPPFETEISALLDRVSLVWVSFLRGQFALMVVMGALVGLMNWLLGTPQALLLGILAGFLEIIPSLGPTLAAVPAALLALFLGSAHFPGLNPALFMLIVIAGYVLLNLVENQVLVPQILGDAVDLPPLIVIVGVTIAGVQAGIAGIFLATPIIATGRELLVYVYAKIREMPEAGPPQEEKRSIRDRLRGLAGRIPLPSRQAAGTKPTN